ncbi:UNVERIFIED_CONTAM: hypothetical protein PYX00_003543 [Menopon gallinae]|uniref:Protein takeout n=1 Tax=Menopon gallinae TaxID=328185 RepID=A0AAW2I107_9NEOP
MRSATLQVFAVVCFVQAISAASVGKLPPSFDICHTSKPDFTKCLGAAVEEAVHTLKDGYPPLGLYPIDPLDITALNIDQGSGPVSIDLKFKDLKIYGFKDAKISDVKADVPNFRFSAKVTVPEVSLKGKYNINGKVLILPITGNGDCVLTMDDVAAQVELLGKERKKDGRLYMNVQKFDFKFDLKKFKLKFENLFNGDKALGENMNQFINENWNEILLELKPSIQEAFGAVFAEISNRIFSKVPYNDIFPE